MPYTRPKSFKERLASLDHWQHREKHKFNLEEFAMAGFFFEQSFDLYDDPGRLRCAYCPAVIGNWQPEDDPWKEHVLSVECDCPHVLMYKGEEYVEWVQQCEAELETETDDQDGEIKFTNIGNFDLVGLPSSLLRHEQRESKSPANMAGIINAEMERLAVRLKSFESCVNHAAVNQLAESGFYFQGLDEHGINVRCYSCGLRVIGIDDNDDIWKIHAQMSACEHVMRKKGLEFIHDARYQHQTRLSGGAPENMNFASGKNKMPCKGGRQERSINESGGISRRDFYWFKGRWFDIQWRTSTKISRCKTAHSTNQQQSARDGDLDWGGGEGEM